MTLPRHSSTSFLTPRSSVPPLVVSRRVVSSGFLLLPPFPHPIATPLSIRTQRTRSIPLQMVLSGSVSLPSPRTSTKLDARARLDSTRSSSSSCPSPHHSLSLPIGIPFYFVTLIHLHLYASFLSSRRRSSGSSRCDASLSTPSPSPLFSNIPSFHLTPTLSHLFYFIFTLPIFPSPSNSVKLPTRPSKSHQLISGRVPLNSHSPSLLLSPFSSFLLPFCLLQNRLSSARSSPLRPFG